MQAAEFVRVVEHRPGFKIGGIEEVVWRAGFIDDTRMRALAGPLVGSGYGRNLLRLLDERSDEPPAGRWPAAVPAVADAAV